jgi:hypothetical protein
MCSFVETVSRVPACELIRWHLQHRLNKHQKTFVVHVT